MGWGEPPSLAKGDGYALDLFQNGWAVAADFIDAQGYLLKWVLSPECGTGCDIVTTNTDPSRGEIFWMFDENGDRSISKDEKFSLMGGEKVDTDGDGMISQDEYTQGFDLLDLR